MPKVWKTDNAMTILPRYHPSLPPKNALRFAQCNTYYQCC